MSYPRECPVVRWKMGSHPRLLLGPGRGHGLVSASMSDFGHGSVDDFRLDELKPLNKAARDLLAALRAEVD